MDTGNSSSTIPCFDSNFPVDFVLDRDTTVSSGWQADWHVRGRLIQNKYLKTNDTDAEATGTWGQFDYNNGWLNRQGSNESNWQSWMWKRHAGFDVVCYEGDGSGGGRQIRHSLNKVPEMMWLFGAGGSDREVYHKGLGGGSSPETKSIKLNESDAETITRWQNTAPTNTVFTISNSLNTDNDKWRAFLFASVDGISKVGSFTNSGGTTTVSCGFQPRFIIVKRAASSGNWYVYDTIRGINAGGEPTMNLNDNSASTTHTADDLDLTSTGFTIPTSSSNIGYSGNYIFYAHA